MCEYRRAEIHITNIYVEHVGFGWPQAYDLMFCFHSYNKAYMILCCVQCIRPQNEVCLKDSDHDVKGTTDHFTQGEMEGNVIEHPVDRLKCVE